MNRFFDIIFASLGLAILSPIFLLILIIGLFDTGAPLFIQQRIGKGMVPFYLIKFRTMRINMQSVGTHLVDTSSVTKWGSLLRITKMDELPQLWNVLIGDMSLVGPYPNLPNQTELIHERNLRKVYSVRPGITGLAQIQKIDMSTPQLLSETDALMIETFSLANYFFYLLKMVSGNGFGDRVQK
jgi:lipopolysaccharide/colanic/teichoic acid biosynthesis glycosyltransferase